MKLKYLLTGALLSILAPVSAQYLPLISGDALWSHVEIHCLPGYNSYSSRYYAFKGDTVIGETIYQQLFATDEADQTQWYLWGFYREDTSTGKVWYRTVFPENEGIAYDFSAQTGDTVWVYNPAFSSEPILLTVQETSLTEIGGIQRRQLKMYESQHFQSETWLEGIGSLYGIKNSGMSWAGAACGSEELLCYWKNGNNLWQNQAYETCFFQYTGREDPQSSHPRISFNPSEKTLKVNELKPVASLYIYNLQGKKMMNLLLGKPTSLSLKSLPQGIYLVRLVEADRMSVLKIRLF